MTPDPANEPQPLTDDELVDVRARPVVASTSTWSEDKIDRLIATVDAERTRAEKAEAELRTMRIAHRSNARLARSYAEMLTEFAEIMDSGEDDR